MSTLHLNSVRKVAPVFSERTVRLEDTLARARLLAAEKGVTRLADITGLDRIGIPVFTAVVPKSDDAISVYNGKGVSTLEARTGALMESIERQTALDSQLEVVEGSYRGLQNGRTPAVDPMDFNRLMKEDYGCDQRYEWVHGHDLLAGETVLVPAAFGGFGPRFAGAGSPFLGYSTNGLASGNCLEEAVCHALCELIERDAWTLAELRSRWIPVAQREALFGREVGAAGIDDCDVCPRIDLNNAGWPISELMEKFARAGLRPVVRDLGSDLGITCVIASASDDDLPDFPQAHSGLGAHPNARIAVVRALTELAQSRAVDIQAVREDIVPADSQPATRYSHTRRIETIDHRRWVLRHEGRLLSLAAMSSVENEDVQDDIRMILAALGRENIQRVIIIDLTEPGGFSVVRAVIPGLEYAVIGAGRLGPRAVRFWKRHAAGPSI